jgi:hypothetical protein
MLVRLKPSAISQTEWWEYLVRFVFGGLATVLAGIAARYGGPTVGGLFLAFPAIFCASATLVERHERQRKEKRGLSGRRRGQLAAAQEAAAAGLGSIGLMAFGMVVWLLIEAHPVSSLPLALVGWLATSITLWWLRRYLRRTR